MIKNGLRSDLRRNLKMVQFTMANGIQSLVPEKALESPFGRMEQDTKDFGKLIEQMEKASVNLLTETFTKAI